MSNTATAAEFAELVRETFTQEQIELILSCKPGERVVVRGNELFKVSEACLIEEAGSAIEVAIKEILMELAVTWPQEIATRNVDWKVYSPELKVTISLVDGRESSRTLILTSKGGMH